MSPETNGNPPYPGLLPTLRAAQFEFTTLIPRLANPYRRNAEILAVWLAAAIHEAQKEPRT